MGVEPERVVRVRTPGATRGIYRHGSGYLIGRGLILTAAHVLVPPDQDVASAPRAGQPCEVAGADADDLWSPGQLHAASAGFDVAVIRSALGTSLTPARWGRLAGAQAIAWDALGYPYAGLRGLGREAEHVWGEVSPLTAYATGRLGLTVSTRTPRHTGSVNSGWAGFSGAAVICENLIVGVITEDPGAYQDSLTGVRADALLGDQAFAAALGHPDLTDVRPRARAADSRPAGSGPVVLIVDDEDAELMRQQLSDIESVTATDVASALALIVNPDVRIDAALVDICVGEPTGVSGRDVLEALRQHRPNVPRSVVSADPFIGLSGDIGAVLERYGAFRTLRKAGAGRQVPELRACVVAMLRQDDDVIAAIVRDAVNELSRSCVPELRARRAAALMRRRRGEIGESELGRAAARVAEAEAAVATAREDSAMLEGADKWAAVTALRAELAAIVGDLS